MFSEQTETELRRNLQWEAGMQGLVTLHADAYRELVLAARRWDAMMVGRSPERQIVAWNPGKGAVMADGTLLTSRDDMNWTVDATMVFGTPPSKP
jgi:hypothetical protein